MGSHIFTTTAPNSCAKCPRRISAGVKAVLNEHGIVHLACDEPEAQPKAKRPHKRTPRPVCRDCWTIHEGRCSDDLRPV